MLNTITRIKNPIPVLSEMSSSFSCCLSAILIRKSTTRFQATSKSTTVKMQQIYGQLLTASGLAFSYVYKDNYISHFRKIEYYTAFDNDQYIDYAMNYGNCNYEIISTVDYDALTDICNSINHDMPVLAEGLNDLGWSLITGYDELGQLYGYSPNCNCCTDCVNCIQRKPSPLVSEFALSDWKTKLKRVIIIKDFYKERADTRNLIEHWISLMERKPQNGYIFGNDAIDAMIHLLEDDIYIKSLEDGQLKTLYRWLYTNSFIPDYRFYMAKSIYDILEVPYLKKVPLENKPLYELASKVEKIRKYGFDSHATGWKYWAALSEKEVWQVDARRYAPLLRNSEIRKLAVKELKILKEIDTGIIALLKDIKESQDLKH